MTGRTMTGRLLAAAAAIAAAGLAGAAYGAPEGGKPGKEEKVTKMIVITERHSAEGKAEGKHEGPEVHSFRIVRDGKGGPGPGPGAHAFALGGDGVVKCDGGDVLVDETAGDDKDKTKIFVCAKGASGAQNVERLEEALGRIQANSEISAEHKAKITAALQAAIDRARTTR